MKLGENWKTYERIVGKKERNGEKKQRKKKERSDPPPSNCSRTGLTPRLNATYGYHWVYVRTQLDLQKTTTRES